MTTTSEYWKAHIKAIGQAGCSTSGYAKRHGLSVATLYYWQRKLRLAAQADISPRTANKFVSLTVTPSPAISAATTGTACILVLDAGIRLEFLELPDPSWLISLAQAREGGR